MAILQADFAIPETTVADVSRELAHLTRSVVNMRFHSESPETHYQLRAPSRVRAQWDVLLGTRRDLPQHVVSLNAVLHDEQDDRVEDESKPKALVFRIREKNRGLIQVTAECGFAPVADGFSALLRGLARFGAPTTRAQLLASHFQERLGEFISDNEKQEWEELRLALPAEQVEPPQSDDLVEEEASAHTISQEAELQEIGPSETAPQYVFRKSGNVWEIAYGECEFHLEDLKGLGLIHELLHRPNYPFQPPELEIALEGTAVELLGRDEREQLDGVSDGGINQPVLDEQTLQEVEEALEGLKTQLLTAQQERKEVRAKELEGKIEKCEDYLRRSTGKGGKPRRFRDDFEKARVRVTQNIRTATDAIQEQCPPLAEYLANYIETGSKFVYKLQSPKNPWSL